jgi:hypothetical protein
MATQKQIHANRENAKKSTGPSAAGKARSRLNALRDGLTGQITTLSDKDRPVFEQLKAELIAGFDPQTPIERKLAHAIAWDTWRLDHLRAIEMNVYALGAEESMRDDEAESLQDEAGAEDTHVPDELDTALADARTFRAEAKRFELMSLYETRMNRSMHRNLTTLRDLQAERKRNYERDKKDEVLIARLHEFNDMPIQASTTPSKNGFLFSNEEIAVGAARQRYVDTAGSILKNTNPTQLYGTLRIGCRDSLLEKVADQRPLSQEERNEIDKVPLEARVIHRLNHPEEYGLSKP